MVSTPFLRACWSSPPLRGAAGRGAGRFWAQSVVGVGAAVGLAEAGKKIGVWPGHPNFPSGHTTFAAASAACLYLRLGPRSLWVTAPLTGAMMASLVVAGYHTPDETLAALVLGPVVVVGVWRLTRPRIAG